MTTASVTLIDNIYTSELEYKIDSGLLVNDINDHLASFDLYKCNVKSNVTGSSNKYIYYINEENINALKHNLIKKCWNHVFNNEDANLAYDNFLHTFTQMYNKQQPLKIVSLKYLN